MCFIQYTTFTTQWLFLTKVPVLLIYRRNVVSNLWLEMVFLYLSLYQSIFICKRPVSVVHYL